MQISIVASGDSLTRSLVSVTLASEVPILYLELDSESVKLTLRDHLDELRAEVVPLQHACISCSLRVALVPLLEELSGDFLKLIVMLPPGVELINVGPALSDAIGESSRELVLCSAACVCGLSELSEGLLTHQTLHDTGRALFDGDDRCLGEVLLSNVCYADMVITLGNDQLSSDLLEHLRSPHTRRIDHLESLFAEEFFGEEHDPDAAIARVHPVTTTAWGGPSTSGVWTLDLHSNRPFHPARLRERIAELAPEGVCVRGCFWLPARTDQVCTIDSTGGQVSIGSAGEWHEDPFTHVIVVGVGAPEVKEQLEWVFHECLMGPEDQGHAHESTLHDRLPDWFGEE